MSITENTKDYEDLKRAVCLLQSPSIVAKMSNLLGAPVESLVKNLPPSVSKKIGGLVEAALYRATDLALLTISNKPNTPSSTKLNKMYAATSGAVGGAFGFTSLLIEIPVSTILMMRAVADVARSEGFDLSEFSTKCACIEVFAMGGNTKDDDSTEIGYYITRSFLAESMRYLSKDLSEVAAKKLAESVAQAAAQKSAQHGTKMFRSLSYANVFPSEKVSSVLAGLIEKVAARFGIPITQKTASQAVPLVGAASGLALNTLFVDFYQDMARGHFIIKRLEKKYGYDYIKSEYKKVMDGIG